MSQFPGQFLAAQLSGLQLDNQTVQLIDDARCFNCGGHGHFEESCDLFEHTKLNGRSITLIVRAPDSQVHFNTSLPWLTLRFNQILRTYNTDPHSIANHGNLINVMLDFMGHLTELPADDAAASLNHARTSHEIVTSWKLLEEEAIYSTLELVSNVVNSLREFEKSEIIAAIASDLINMHHLPAVNQVRYSDVWEHIVSAEPDQYLSKPIDCDHFRHFLTILGSHRSRYLARQAQIDAHFRSAVSRHQIVREDARALTAFVMPKLLAIEIKNAATTSLGWDDFKWPSRESIARGWLTALGDPELQGTGREDLDVTGIFDSLSI
ncbi:hypothetical protein H2200_005739 [Cladophialophora chaetospira]|uniref:CCHC-type domain-containing protein n=1 Tax=Cladophialophora chaetospira TaxID=386627 RepID=A0AA38X9M0_9EURO|nr:hypothetical protein H2200_005739 [Cladophialophora chaetospira]